MLSLALLKLGDTEKAKKIAMISWLDQKFDKQNFELMVKNFGIVISINNHKRLKNLLYFFKYVILKNSDFPTFLKKSRGHFEGSGFKPFVILGRVPVDFKVVFG